MIQWLIDLIFSRGHNVQELARRLELDNGQLSAIDLSYKHFSIPKKSGKPRQIAAPNSDLKRLQRRMLNRLLSRLAVHPAATGFRKQVSFVDNALFHQGQAVVIRIDLIDFFPSITERTVNNYFRAIGWNRKAARLMAKLTTHQGSLPQGAPTSPILSNLINYRFDARLNGLATSLDGRYTRYADDITISFSDDRDVHDLIGQAFRIIRGHGYNPHFGQKFAVRRAHQRQTVTGLVVNENVNLPREKRRWLRAVKHRFQQRQSGVTLVPSPTVSAEQLQGWVALERMIERDAGRSQ